MYRLIVLFLFFYSSTDAQRGPIRFAKIDLEAAKQRATIEDKLIFIDTYASYCLPCKKLDIEFKNPKLAGYMNKHFINVKVDMESENGPALKRNYEVFFLPTLIFLDKHGNLKFKIDELVTANELLAYAKHFQEKQYGPKEAIASTSQKPSSPQPIAEAKIQKTKIVKRVEPARQETVTTPTRKVQATTNGLAKDEKILYVFGQGGDNLPPEILKQEAYFRMQLMDGSHQEAAAKYLATQDDWLSQENVRFLFDFLPGVHSKEFDFLVKNKSRFEEILGANQVKTSLWILINKELERGFPRPNLEQSEKLYAYIDPVNSNTLANEYFINRHFDEGKLAAFITLGEEYLDTHDCSNVNLINNLVNQMTKSAGNKKRLRKTTSFSEKALSLDPNNSVSLFNHATLLYKLGNKKDAWDQAKEALKFAMSEDVKKDINLLLQSIGEM